MAVWAEPLLVWLAAGCLIALATWPWVAHLGSALSTHWDLGLHAWKLNWNARHILDGGWLLPGYHANFFYPQAYTLALDDLFWFPSYLAALILGLSHNPILTYNLTFLCFWAFNAPALFLLLRELGLGRPAAWLGGLAFALSPYLVSYYLEFNGTLCFGIPLVMWLLLRFLKRPGWWRALWLVLAFVAQAVSALYYTVILSLSLPLLLAPLLLRQWPELIRSRRFWAQGLAGLAVLVGLSLFYLHPYILLHNHLGLGRGLAEMSLHSADALSYLANASVFVSTTGLPWPGWWLPATRAEVILWPGLVVLALAAVYWWRSLRELNAGRKGGVSFWGGLRWVRVVALVVFWAWLALALITVSRSMGSVLGELVVNLAILAILISTLLISLSPEPRGLTGRFLAGLATAAFLCFFISLGPSINVGDHQALASNWMVDFLADIEVLHITRVLSRYGVMVVLALSVAGAVAFDRLPLRAGARYALLALALAVIVLEADIPISQPYVDPPHYPDTKFEAFLRGQEPCAVAVLPLGDRALDSMYMLQVAGSSPRRYLVNGWTGFRYDYGVRLGRLFSRGDWLDGCRELSRLWPEPLLVVDRGSLKRYVLSSRYRSSEHLLRDKLPVVYQDQYYTVFKPTVPLQPSPRYERWVRSDLLERAQRIRFQARCPGAEGGQPALLYVNDGVKARLKLGPQWRSYDLELKNPDLSIPYNAVALVSPPGHPAPLEVRDFRLILR